ncbi:HMG-Y-related protein A-like [Neltuma alba]|uniref:HMG-Y-related protein A-like n=1 Tax=Neltuma alba TaxID=207710 RepID=UPI0010A505F5|nr:HMG-Y-related protein A-like [Prosopis alba]
MDPSSIPPPPTFTAPPTAVPASAPAPSANLTSANYPPYAEMIRTALAALNERNGSSKKTIAKFIEQAYPRLPSNHPALLTQHLNLLKSNALLVMVKKSYKLPKFDASPPTAQRKRGRPPKRKPNADPQPQPQSLVRQNANPQATRRGPGRPPKARRNIVDQPGPPARWGGPPGSQRPGCPSKPKSELAFSNGTNWRPGRPPKNQTNTTAIPLAPPGPAVLAKTVTSSTVPTVPPDSSLPSIPSRGRGRPKKNAAAVPPSGAILQAVGAGHGAQG